MPTIVRQGIAQVAAADELAPASRNPAPYIRIGVIVIVCIFGGLGTWATVAPLRGAVIAPGLVTVISNRKTVQHFEGGIVAELQVEDGDVVASGQPLLRLDDTRARSELGVLDTHLDVLRAREQRLTDEREGREEASIPAALAERQTDPELSEILAGQRHLFDARRSALRGEVEILSRREEQLGQEILGLRSQLRAHERQMALIQEALDGQLKLFEAGYAPRDRVRELESELERLRGERGEVVADIARAKTAIGETQLRTIQLQKDFQEEVVAELHEVQGRIFDLEDRRVAALDALTRLVVLAPRAGTVVGLRVHTVGGVLAPGDPILDIVPDDDELVVEARLRPEDVDKVSIGLPVSVRLTAFDRRDTPRLDGSLIHVSADRISDHATDSPYYLVRTRIPEPEATLGEALQLVPGMPAEVFIETDERTVMSYLLKPLRDGLARSLREG